MKSKWSKKDGEKKQYDFSDMLCEVWLGLYIIDKRMPDVDKLKKSFIKNLQASGYWSTHYPSVQMQEPPPLYSST